MKVQHRFHRTAGVVVIGLAAAGLAACSSDGDEPAAPGSSTASDQPAEDPAEFYQGKTVTVVIPYDPGGGFDSFVRLLEPSLEAQLDGVQVNLENRPGGGGLIGANEIYNAKPDGLTFGLINYPGAVFAQATDTEGVTFDNADWTFLARLGAINPIVYTGKDSGYPDFPSIMNATEPITFGIGGAGSDAYYATVILSNLLGFPANIVAGYSGGGEADAALLVGEVDAGVGSVDATLTRIKDTGTFIDAIISTEPNPKIPDVPVITSFGTDEQKDVLTALASVYDLERTLVAPPGVPEDRVEFLADAIYQATQDQAYQDAMTEAGLTSSPLPRAEVQSRADAVQQSVDTLTSYIDE